MDCHHRLEICLCSLLHSEIAWYWVGCRHLRHEPIHSERLAVGVILVEPIRQFLANAHCCMSVALLRLQSCHPLVYRFNRRSCPSVERSFSWHRRSICLFRVLVCSSLLPFPPASSLATAWCFSSLPITPPSLRFAVWGFLVVEAPLPPFPRGFFPLSSDTVRNPQ
jgi:hypothetical protein